MRPLVLFLMVIALAVVASAARAGADWVFGVYVDVGYLHSDNQPDNRTWRSKGTTNKFDRIEGNLATGYVRKNATKDSRWGLEFGLQTGVDVDGLVSSPPPPANEPITNAEDWAALAPTSLSYLFPAGRGLLVRGGLLSSYIGYESYHARDNAHYTRGYLSDYVPYFLWGVQASYPVTDRVTADLVVSTGFNYLTNPTSAPSWGTQVTWQPLGGLAVRQNLYYGPDQSASALKYWRFFSDTWVEWQSGMYLMAAAYDFGHERQAWLPGTPYYQWMSGAVWARINISESWRFGVRPEIYWDPDGLMTGARQTLRALATTLEFSAEFLGYHSLSARIEYRYDKSTGDDRGFYAGSDNHLVPEQNLFVVALMWWFDWQKTEI